MIILHTPKRPICLWGRDVFNVFPPSPPSRSQCVLVGSPKFPMLLPRCSQKHRILSHHLWPKLISHNHLPNYMVNFNTCLSND